MRIIAGKWKSRKLESFFEQKNTSMIRPTTDRVKENIFNILFLKMNIRILIFAHEIHIQINTLELYILIIKLAIKNRRGKQ